MRLIDADALLVRMKKAMESGSNLNGTFDLHIEHAPTIQRPTREWIPCSERLPSESGRYLVAYPLFTRGNNWLNIMHFGKPSMPNIKVKGKCWYMPDDEYGDVVYDDVLAWMPLPEPCKGGDA